MARPMSTFPDRFRLDGRTALVTGSGRGLGWEMAKGLAEATHGPAFSTAAGLLLFAMSERAESPRPQRSAPHGVFGRVGHWLRENF